MHQIKIAPSILALKDINQLKVELKKLEAASADLIHIDVMDGIFVENKTPFLDVKITEQIREVTTLPLDIHLMVEEPEKYINNFLNAGADMISIHCESNGDHNATIKKIQENRKKAGIAINPATEIEKVLPFCENVDFILVMAVVPGKCGQQYIEAVNEKIQKLRQLFPTKDIEVDGGIKAENIYLPINAGANIIVSGTGIFNTTNYKETIEKMKHAIILGADHAGFQIKEKVKGWLKEEKYPVIDCGAYHFDPYDDYPDFISMVAKEVSRNPSSKGIIIGGSGQAEAIVANKYKNVRAMLFNGLSIPTQAADIKGRISSDPFEIIRLGREHNNANILSLGIRFLKEEDAKRAVFLWLETPFPDDERHVRRINKIRKIEEENMNGREDKSNEQ